MSYFLEFRGAQYWVSPDFHYERNLDNDIKRHKVCSTATPYHHQRVMKMLNTYPNVLAEVIDPESPLTGNKQYFVVQTSENPMPVEQTWNYITLIIGTQANDAECVTDPVTRLKKLLALLS